MRSLALFIAVLSAGTAVSAATRWSTDDLAQLSEVAVIAGQEGLDAPRDIAAMVPGASTDDAADAIALGLARDFLEGSARTRDDPSWHLPRGTIDYRAWLDAVLDKHAVVASYRALLPATPAYAAVRTALEQCRAGRGNCDLFERNLDRARAFPREPGRDYVWVNVPAYRLDVIRDGKIVASHKVIVGKPTTQTPTFRATMTGVTVNPWWNVPCSIVDESIGKLIRNNPAEAARRGFVATKGADGKLQVRQKPGPNNALGRIKLEMPNPYGVYIHDTPSRDLFANDKRAFSHGCIRAQDPEGLAEAVLGDDQASALAVLLAGTTSRTIHLSRPLPVYVVYFTAELDPRTGQVVSYTDIYHRDGKRIAATP